jgi:hypothetical protein
MNTGPAEMTYVPPVAEESFASPEEAAMAAFPPRYVRVEGVESFRDGNEARVALLTNEEPYLYPYFVYCVRTDDGRWIETDSHN